MRQRQLANSASRAFVAACFIGLSGCYTGCPTTRTLDVVSVPNDFAGEVIVVYGYSGAADSVRADGAIVHRAGPSGVACTSLPQPGMASTRTVDVTDRDGRELTIANYKVGEGYLQLLIGPWAGGFERGMMTRAEWVALCEEN